MLLTIARGIQKASHRVERTPVAILHWPLFWMANGGYFLANIAQRIGIARIEARRTRRKHP